jgi:hypothetical protein
MVLGSTQPLVKMSTRNIPGGKAAGAWGCQPHHLHVPNIKKSGSLDLLEPSGRHRACYGTPLPFNITFPSDHFAWRQAAPSSLIFQLPRVGVNTFYLRFLQLIFGFCLPYLKKVLELLVGWFSESLGAGRSGDRIPVGRDFPHPTELSPGLTQPPVQWVPALFSPE